MTHALPPDIEERCAENDQAPASNLGHRNAYPSLVECLESPTGLLNSDAVDRALELCCLRPDASIISLSDPQNPPGPPSCFARILQLPVGREILLPLLIGGNHWVLACIRFTTFSAEIYSSLPLSASQDNAIKSLLEQFLSIFAPDQDFAKLKITTYDSPLQEDNLNSGMFIIAVAFYLASRTPLPHEPFHTQIWRVALRLLLVGTGRSTLWPFAAIDSSL